jgi:hypothetical protein
MVAQLVASGGVQPLRHLPCGRPALDHSRAHPGIFNLNTTIGAMRTGRSAFRNRSCGSLVQEVGFGSWLCKNALRERVKFGAESDEACADLADGGAIVLVEVRDGLVIGDEPP